MSFRGLFDGGSGGGDRVVADAPYRGSMAMSAGSISQPFLTSPSLPNPVFTSPGLSLALCDAAVAGKGGRGEQDSLRRSKEDENESRSGGSDNLEVISGDDFEQENPRKKKRYHRHTPQQIQELEAEAMRNPICSSCGGPAVLGDVSLEEQHLRIENARLKDELDRVCSLIGKFLGKPVSVLAGPLPVSISNSSLELAVGTNAFGGLGSVVTTTLPPVAHFVAGLSSPLDMFPSVVARSTTTGVISGGMGGSKNGSLQLVSSWHSDVIVRAYHLFPLTLIPHCKRIACGQMHAELQVLSPLVPVRHVQFLRFCKQLAEAVWAVVDVSIDGIRDSPSVQQTNCRRLPSGCVVQDLLNGYSKVTTSRRCGAQVTWVEHAEYDEATVHPLYRPLLSSGMALGAHRWVAALQRQCHSLAVLVSSTLPPGGNTRLTLGCSVAAITPSGRRSMLKLAQRMTDNFCAGVCASSAHQWNKLRGGVDIGEDVRVMTRQSVADPGEPPGVVLSAATSVWLPVSPQRLFDFLRNERLRSQWDILSNGGPMQEMAHIAKGQDATGNAVTLLRASVSIYSYLSLYLKVHFCSRFSLPFSVIEMESLLLPVFITCSDGESADQSSMLILQETCTDASGSLVVYAPVDVPAMHLVMSGGDSSYVALLPSGFAILPDGRKAVGSLLTVAFQILVNSQPTAKLTVESVETVNNLISCTVQKIKAALRCEA
ncbi:hypothetical protein B296_00040123 [Ensete ventricosum]|uniref:START domain-containing protein n=1 Tax=Ensete ventricosum TaxID=4639 RepID=A0A426ZRB1_ENSVE|nr:hypothetical protein B296_00040123 [Ensete ventricosum]